MKRRNRRRLAAGVAAFIAFTAFVWLAMPDNNQTPSADALQGAQLEQLSHTTEAPAEVPSLDLTQIDDVTLTHYCICERCCGKTPDHPAYGITASGRKAEPYISVAVDKSIIPLGSTVFIEYPDGTIRTARADDTGGAVKGNHIDLCVEDHQTAKELGKKQVKIYWTEEEVQMPDAYSQWMAHQAEQDRELAARPVCCYCEEPIQDETCYEIEGELICKECLDNHFQKYTEDCVF